MPCNCVVCLHKVSPCHVYPHAWTIHLPWTRRIYLDAPVCMFVVGVCLCSLSILPSIYLHKMTNERMSGMGKQTAENRERDEREGEQQGRERERG